MVPGIHHDLVVGENVFALAVFSYLNILKINQPAILLSRLIFMRFNLLVDVLVIFKNEDGCVWRNLICNAVHVNRHAQSVKTSTDIRMGYL